MVSLLHFSWFIFINALAVAGEVRARHQLPCLAHQPLCSPSRPRLSFSSGQTCVSLCSCSSLLLSWARVYLLRFFSSPLCFALPWTTIEEEHAVGGAFLKADRWTLMEAKLADLRGVVSVLGSGSLRSAMFAAPSEPLIQERHKEKMMQNSGNLLEAAVHWLCNQ